VIVAGPNHPPIRAPKDVEGRTLLVFEQGCPHRMRLEAWFAEHKVQVDRVIEMGSYHAILGCAVAGMGVALVPKIVLDTFTERRQLSLYPMRGRYKAARTLLIWRRDQPSARVRALADAIGASAHRA
jgi:DNA-binding transcriptional LysR family regulator